MVLGTTSGAGKSWLATALCRWYARRGLKVAPFKAQNMSNHARVVAAGNGLGEIGSAQYFQALAARTEPEVRMNPVLLKPEANSKAQVVLLGQVNNELTQMPWRDRSEMLWPFITESLDALCAENDVVVIEGAGSPAEINLMDRDIVNLHVARHANARCLLVTDIDRGGAFAHLYGTWALLSPTDQALIQGFVLNKFRGDATLLSPAPEKLLALTGVCHDNTDVSRGSPGQSQKVFFCALFRLLKKHGPVGTLKNSERNALGPRPCGQTLVETL